MVCKFVETLSGVVGDGDTSNRFGFNTNAETEEMYKSINQNVRILLERMMTDHADYMRERVETCRQPGPGISRNGDWDRVAQLPEESS